jgi:hypothetical protein
MPHWSRRELSIGRLFRPFSLLLGARYAHNFVSKSTDCSRKNGSQTMPSEASIFPKNPMKKDLFRVKRYSVCVGGVQCTVYSVDGNGCLDGVSQRRMNSNCGGKGRSMPGHGIWLQLSSSNGVFGEDILRQFPNQLWCQTDVGIKGWNYLVI